MTAALILTSASHTIACASCNAPWPLAVAQCPGCGRREVASITARAAAPSPDDLRAQLAAVTAERDALRAAARMLAAADAEYRHTDRACDADVRRIEDASRALFALVPEVPA
mgnify:CR=1 FL=1